LNTSTKSTQTTEPLDIEFGGFSHQGVKEENQDAFAAQQPNPVVRDLKGSIVCIADGVSSSEKSQVASQTAVTTFINDYFSTPDSWRVQDSVARVLTSLNNWLFHHGQQAKKQNDLVTTFSGVIFKSNTAYIFHSGDSRVYLLRNQTLQQLTKDHVRFHNENSSYLTRALGMDSHLEVDLKQVDIEQGDVFMLTTDGVHEHVDDSFVKQQLKTNNGALEQAAKTISQQALDNGSQDNVTCLLAHVANVPNKDIDEVGRELTALRIPPVMNVGMKIDNFQIDDVLFSGTRSHVYLVTNTEDKQQYVLKAPSENFAEDLAYLESFAREQWVGCRLNHKAIMRVYPREQMNANSHFRYHICEYVPGKTLRQWMYDNPNPSLTAVRTLVVEIVSALRAFQRQGMVHRDIKPENIIVLDNGHIKLVDFGTVQVNGLDEISSPIEEDNVVGAVGYMAPEYLMGQKGTARSDMFSLGIIVYEMLTGELPYKKPLIQRREVSDLTDWQYISVTQHRQDVPRWLDLVLEKVTAARPSQRYSSFSEFVTDLSVPNKSMLEKLESAPLLERDPVNFWKLISIALFLLLLFQTYWFNR